MGQRKPNRKQSEETKQSRWGFRGMTVRNWLELLIVPLVLVGIGLLFEMRQADRQEATEKQQQELAEQRAQDEALQAYLNQMSQLILDRKLLEPKQRDPFHADPVYTLAQARTSTVILRLDAEHNTSVIRFLMNSGLAWSKATHGRATMFNIAQDSGGPPPASVSLLTGITLNRADLSGADLSWADLRWADLSGADLRQADLRQANLSEANLSEANLRGADLSGVGSSGAFVIDHVNLSEANLSNADLSNADLSNADLSKAVNWTEKQLMAARSLEGATMPNGQKYEDWLKSKD